MTQTRAQHVTADAVTGISYVTIRAGEVQLAALGPVELATFLIPGLCAGCREIYRHRLVVELRLVVGNESCHFAALDILYRLFTISLQTPVQIGHQGAQIIARLIVYRVGICRRQITVIKAFAIGKSLRPFLLSLFHLGLIRREIHHQFPVSPPMRVLWQRVNPIDIIFQRYARKTLQEKALKLSDVVVNFSFGNRLGSRSSQYCHAHADCQ